ncbi:MAG: UDP-2,4-diacetamido-2,4,6-trideoxy-beta-L-altropyranose hydrolase [Psychromonas sp.]|nr:UDP-2,4-diacetamido-2,4,6-trideoxy-beta-L-altropyranose hydrolase [Psychromonas sp.]
MTYPILFRFDGGNKIGLGHAYRCFALIEYLALHHKIICLIIVNQLPEFLCLKLKTLNCSVLSFKKNDDEIAIIKRCSAQNNSTGLILDGYQFDQAYRLKLARLGLKIICFDDTNSLRKLHCDIIINSQPQAKLLGYQYSAPYALHLLGLCYSIVCQDFIASRKLNFCDRKKILINFGGSDCTDLTITFIQKLAIVQDLIDPCDVVIVTGGAYSSPDKVDDLCQDAGFEHVHNSQNMARLLTRCRMAICAAGSIVYELAYCGVPSILLTVADNQLFSAQSHQKAGWCYAFDGLDSHGLRLAFSRAIYLWADNVQLTAMSEKAMQLIDGKGVKRITDQILKILD